MHVRVLPQESQLSGQLQKGDFVPGYDEWRLTQPLGDQEPPRVWLARHRNTREVQIFKFAHSEESLQALQREKTVHRALQRTAGVLRSSIEVGNWRFNSKPYFLQMKSGGQTLAAWSNEQRAAGELTRERCLDLMADLAEVIASAHDTGILHNDLSHERSRCGSPDRAILPADNTLCLSLRFRERPSHHSREVFQVARRKAGLPKSTVLYTGRHTFGTRVLASTENISLVMRAMGHSSVATAMRYQHPDLELVRSAVNEGGNRVPRHNSRHSDAA